MKRTLLTLMAFASLTIASSATELQGSLLNDIDRAFTVHDDTTVLEHVGKGGMNYYGKWSLPSYIRQDMINDARIYSRCRTTVNPSTFRRSFDGPRTCESVSEEMEAWGVNGKHHHAHCVFTIVYNTNSLQLVSVDLRVTSGATGAGDYQDSPSIAVDDPKPMATPTVPVPTPVQVDQLPLNIKTKEFRYRLNTATLSNRCGDVLPIPGTVYLKVNVTIKNVSSEKHFIGGLACGQFSLSKGDYHYDVDSGAGLAFGTEPGTYSGVEEFPPLISKTITVVFTVPSEIADGTWTITTPTDETFPVTVHGVTIEKAKPDAIDRLRKRRLMT